MKKSTVKVAKTKLAPVKKAIAKIVKTAAAIPAKRAAAKAPAAKAPAVKATAAKLAPTVITAQIDVGFGNALFIRGEGAGLSWDTGTALECKGDSLWSISLPATKAVTYKFLINDSSWSTGEDYVTAAGSKAVQKPKF